MFIPIAIGREGLIATVASTKNSHKRLRKNYLSLVSNNRSLRGRVLGVSASRLILSSNLRHMIDLRVIVPSMHTILSTRVLVLLMLFHNSPSNRWIKAHSMEAYPQRKNGQIGLIIILSIHKLKANLWIKAVSNKVAEINRALTSKKDWREHFLA